MRDRNEFARDPKPPVWFALVIIFCCPFWILVATVVALFLEVWLDYAGDILTHLWIWMK